MNAASSVTVKRNQRIEVRTRKWFACNVWSAMKDQKLTQIELARRTGDNRTRVLYIIHGKHGATLGIAIRIAAALNKPLSRLLKRPERDVYAAWSSARRRKKIGKRR